MAGATARERSTAQLRRRIVWSCIVSFVAGLCLVEVIFRWLLFGGGAAQRLGKGLRHATYYADPASEDDYWKLFLELDGIQQRITPNVYHPELGWVSPDIDNATLAHRTAVRLRGRRPVLLYGDSFARCMGRRSDCFEMLLATSDLDDRFLLLNYGVQGYGLDQIYLLIEKTVDAYAGSDPVVVVTLQIDDSLDRPVLSLRRWPKPRLRIRGDDLVPETTPVPSEEEYLSANPIRIRSYAWRYLLRGTDVLPNAFVAWAEGDSAREEQKQVLDRAIFRAIASGLRARGVEFYFLIFEGQPYLDGSKPKDWRHALLEEFLRSEAVPYTSAGHALREDALRSGHAIADYFDQELRESRGHLLPLGNAVAFRALRDGLEKRFDTSPP